MEQPLEALIVEPPPQRPRLRIAHLLAWTACTALCLGVFRSAVGAFSQVHRVVDVTESPVNSVLLVFASLACGAGLGGLAIWIDCHRRGWRFPVHPGEYLLAIRGVSNLVLVIAVGFSPVSQWTDGRIVQTDNIWPPMIALALVAVEFTPAWASSMTTDRGWELFFFVRGWASVFWGIVPRCIPIVLLANLFGLAVLCLHDYDRGHRFPWTHWLGIASDFWWNVLLLGAIAALLG
jgi:hypothetical protein